MFSCVVTLMLGNFCSAAFMPLLAAELKVPSVIGPGSSSATFSGREGLAWVNPAVGSRTRARASSSLRIFMTPLWRPSRVQAAAADAADTIRFIDEAQAAGVVPLRKIRVSDRGPCQETGVLRPIRRRVRRAGAATAVRCWMCECDRILQALASLIFKCHVVVRRIDKAGRASEAGCDLCGTTRDNG